MRAAGACLSNFRYFGITQALAQGKKRAMNQYKLTDRNETYVRQKIEYQSTKAKDELER